MNTFVLVAKDSMAFTHESQVNTWSREKVTVTFNFNKNDIIRCLKQLFTIHTYLFVNKNLAWHKQET